ncbi:MAG: DUF4440 domain-containing protein [Bryobacterales bacterium]|nr:DUF4440 domain-containing protein [Bryobacterales bacterium]
MLHFKLAPELKAARKAVAEQEHEAVKVELAWETAILVEMEIHIAGNWKPRFRISTRPGIAPYRNGFKRRNSFKRQDGWLRRWRHNGLRLDRQKLVDLLFQKLDAGCQLTDTALQIGGRLPIERAREQNRSETKELYHSDVFDKLMINNLVFTIVKYLSITLLLGSVAPAQEREIRAVLQQQQDDWNRGDVRAFMDGYEASESTTFVAAAVTKGSAAVLANYLKRYPTRDQMGTLTFTILDVRPLGPEHASVIGRFHLKRTAEGGGDKSGIFTLVFRKTTAGWKVILDHTNP